MTVEGLCRYIASHEASVVDWTETTITVIGFWTKPGTRYWGWTIQTLPAEWQAVRDWLGY